MYQVPVEVSRSSIFYKNNMVETLGSRGARTSTPDRVVEPGSARDRLQVYDGLDLGDEGADLGATTERTWAREIWTGLGQGSGQTGLGRRRRTILMEARGTRAETR